MDDEKYYLLDEWADKLGLPRGTEFKLHDHRAKSNDEDKVIHAYLRESYLATRACIAFGGFWTPDWAEEKVYSDGSFWFAPSFRLNAWPSDSPRQSYKLWSLLGHDFGKEARKYETADEAEPPLGDWFFKILAGIQVETADSTT